MGESVETFAVSENGFSLPVTDVLTGRGFVTGKSGSGKSNTASVIAEELLERNLPLLIVDTDGEYYGLRDRYEVLHVGADEECDLSISVEDAGRIATLALDESVPIILDVSGFLDEEESRELVLEVVRALFHAEKSRTKPFLVLVEEAHEFIPQGGGSDDLSEMLIRVAKRGRKRGLGICGLSQRPAAVDKDFITQCDWLVWHRLTWENDTAVAARILGDDAAETIQSLDDGEALVLTDWDESIDRVQFRRKRTFDAGSTPDLEDSRRSSKARSDIIDELSERDRRSDQEPAPEPSADLPTVSEAGAVETVTPSESTKSEVHTVTPAESSTSGGPRTSSPPSPVVEQDPIWEVGEMVVHLYGFVIASHRRAFEVLAATLLARLEAFNDGRVGGVLRRFDYRERLARLLAIAVLIVFYVAVITAIVGLVSAGP